MNDTFYKLHSVLMELASIAAQTAAYGWSDAFSRKEVQEVWLDKAAPLRKSRGYAFRQTDIMNMSDDQLESLGFRRWDDSGKRLIPLWAMNYIAADEIVTSIDGEICRRDECENDQRGGCIAYGFMPLDNTTRPI